MAGRGKLIEAVGYLRTSSAANVGADKDSDKRQRAAIENFAKRSGFALMGMMSKQKLGPISKQGDQYLRRILIVGAHSVLRRARQQPEKYPGSLSFWLGDRSRSSRFAPFEQGEIGPDLFRAACDMGLEGLVSKRRDRPYRAGRSSDWVKVKNRTHPAMSRIRDSF
jgi:hypothetical protein